MARRLSARQGGMKRWRFCATENDFRAMDFIKERLLFETRTHVVRYTLRRQVGRDQQPIGAMDAKTVGLCARIKDSVSDLLMKSRRYGVEELQLRQWSCWLGAQQFADMDAVIRRWGLDHRSEGLRFALRVEAELLGFKPQGGTW